MLTILFIAIWMAGLIIAGETLGGLIHLFLVAALLTGFGIILGVVLLVISLIQKK
ncbi:MAG: hypothetical protein ABI481_00805 [Pyrinomonadaceae bacterium]